MYAPPREVRDYLEHDPQKPYLLCEYMHDMGNSIGGMESYISLLDEFPMYQGGFIWDYIDQAIYRRDVDGREVLGYGGDFGDRPTDYAFSGNGIVFADRAEKPAMQEVRYWYSTKEEREAFDRENREAEALALEQTGSWDAGQTETTAQDFAAEQDFTVIHGDVTLGVKGAGFHVIFSYSEHGMVSLVYDGLEWIYRPGMPAFWRASTENDKGNGFPVKSAVWCGADQFIRCTGWHTQESRCQVRITYDYAACTVPETQVSVSYTVDAAGTVQVRCHYRGQKGLPQLPLFGLRFTVPFVADNVRWQGRSGETYPDRKRAGPLASGKAPLRNRIIWCLRSMDAIWILTGLSCMDRRAQPQRLRVNPAWTAEGAAAWRLPWKKGRFIFRPSHIRPRNWRALFTGRSFPLRAGPWSPFWAPCGAWEALTAGGRMWNRLTVYRQMRILSMDL